MCSKTIFNLRRVARFSRCDRPAHLRYTKKLNGYGYLSAIAKIGYQLFLLAVFALMAFWIIGTSSAIALSGEAPDLSRSTFGSLPAFEEPGQISGGGDLSRTLGYDPARSWEAGDHPADVIKLGDLEESLAPQEFTLAEIGLRSGLDMSNVALSAFPLIKNQTLSGLVNSVPYLGEFTLGDSPPLYDAVITKLFSDSGSTAKRLNKIATHGQGFVGRQVANRSAIAQVNGLDERINQAETGIPSESSGAPNSTSSPPLTSGDGELSNPATERLSDLALDELLGGIDLNDLNLDDYAITDIPNLENATIKDQDGWQDAVVSQVPGLEDVEYSQYPNAVKAALSGIGGTHDVTYGPKESRFTKTKYSISGSFEDGFGVNCAQDRGCAYLELEGAFAMHGARWISGGNGEGQQMVNGGFGVLGNVNGGKEPTGRHPFGEKAFKVVLTKTDESEGKGDFGLYFRVCKRGIPDLGCTPFFLGPVPVYSTREKGFVLTGLLDGGGGSTSGLRAPNGWEELKPRTPRDVQDFIDRNSRNLGNSRSGAVLVDQDCMNGILSEVPTSQREGASSTIPRIIAAANELGVTDKAQVAYILATMEQEVGGINWTPGEEIGRPCGYDGGCGWHGRGYGQLTHEYNYEAMGRKIGVDLVSDPSLALDPDISAKILVIGMRDGDFNKYGYGLDHYINDNQHDFVGARWTVNRQNQAARIARNAEQYYQQISLCSSLETETNGQATGNFVTPYEGSYPITSGFGPRNIGCQRSKFHPAIDVGMGIGTPVNASDGGEVTFAGTAGGYGYTVVIDHGNGTKSRYSHLDKINVEVGQNVTQGENIALSGNTDGNTDISTGPHLDFGIYLNDNSGVNQLPASGNAVDPREYVNFP